MTCTNGKKATRSCKCGYLGDPALGCGRAPKCAREYQSRISGPLFDRIDLHVDVPAVSPADLSLPPARENSAAVAARVARVRELQRARYAELAGNGAAGNGASATRPVLTNAEADGDLLEKVAAPDASGRQLLTQAAERLRLSARGYHRVLRVARTLADMDGADAVKRLHVAEALSYRRIVTANG